MSPRRGLAALLVLAGLALPATAAAVGSGASAEPAPDRGPAGTWTKISFGPITNTSEPGLYRTADGVLHVAYRQQNVANADIIFATIKANGKFAGSGSAVSGWSSLTADPKIVGAPGGGMRLVFAGVRSPDVMDPMHTGQMFSAVADSAGTYWGLQVGALVRDGYSLDSSGSGATTLADGTPVAAITLNDQLIWNVGGSVSDETYDFGQCCTYHASLVRADDTIWSSFAANGDDAAHRGLFVKQLEPTVGATTKVPQSSQGKDTLTPDQATALVDRPGDGPYLAYCIGYPTCTKVGLWKLGTPTPTTVPGSAGARAIAVAAAPNGRLWIAWTTYTKVKIVATSPTGTTFGKVRTLTPPHGVSSLYGVAINGTTKVADVIINSGKAFYHQQVKP